MTDKKEFKPFELVIAINNKEDADFLLNFIQEGRKVISPLGFPSKDHARALKLLDSLKEFIVVSTK